MWVFGYGSLIWRPSFPFVERREGYIQGWGRWFYQGSTDHRGVPGAPGRVVTLLPDADTSCWGAAYRVSPADSERVLAELDHREQGGYDRHTVRVITREDEPLDALMYLATPENSSYLGRASDLEIARQIFAAHGPSGSNSEYLLELERALSSMGVRDPHVSALADLVRTLQSERD